MFKAIYQLFHRHYHRRYHGIYRHAKKLFVFDLFLLATAIGLLFTSAYLLLWNPSLSDQIDLAISVGQDRVLSGEPVTLHVDYTNNTKLTLYDAVLAVHLPRGFILDTQTIPSNFSLNESSFVLNKIGPGAKGEAVLRGQLWSESGVEEKVDVILSYRPDNWKSRDQKISSLHLKLPDSILKLVSNLPTKTFPNQRLPITITITNNGAETVNNLTLRNNFTGLTLSDNQTFSLRPQASQKITGELATPERAGQFAGDLSLLSLVNEQQIVLQKQSVVLSVVSPAIDSQVKITGEATYLDNGGELPIEISWKNNSAITAKNLLLRLKFTPEIIDLPATALANGLTVKNNELVFAATERTALADGRSGNGDNFTIKLKAKSKFDLNTEINPTLKIEPMIEGEVEKIVGQKFQTTGTSAEIKIPTEIIFKTEARYYTNEGDQLGRGPLPPVVGETTKYWVFAQITNSTNDLKNVVFQARLAPGVQFTDKQSVTIGAQLNYNPNTKTLVWSQSALPPHSRTGLYFEVAITPTPEQVGKNLLLLENAALSATDDFTAKKFNFSSLNLYNILPAADRGHNLENKVTY